MKIIIVIFLLAGASGIEIGCTFRNGGWVIVGSQYTCSVTSIDFGGNTTHITGYNGTHLLGVSNLDVKIIDFKCSNYGSDYDLTFLPKGFLNIFPNMIGFDIGYCNITTLNDDDLNDYQNLEFWASFSGILERIPGSFFCINTENAIC